MDEIKDVAKRFYVEKAEEELNIFAGGNETLN
jgi:hypothetical protein